MSDPAALLYGGDVPYGPIDTPSLGVSTSAYLGATWDGFLDDGNLSYFLLDRARMNMDGNAKQLNRDEAQQRFIDAGVTYDVPKQGMSDVYVKYIIDYQKRKAERENLFAQNDSTLNYALSLPTYFAATITDPIQVGSAFIPFISEARYAAAVKATTTPLGRIGTRALQHVRRARVELEAGYVVAVGAQRLRRDRRRHPTDRRLGR